MSITKTKYPLTTNTVFFALENVPADAEFMRREL